MRIACIGSRSLRIEQLQFCREVGKWVASFGTLSSGCAPGADQAFMSGAFQVGGVVDAHLPWLTFEREFQTRITSPRTTFSVPTEREMYEASRHYEKFRGYSLGRCSPGIQKLMARNVGIVEGTLGVIAFPPLLSSKFSSGGTRFGMFVARAMNLPVLDLSIDENPMLSVRSFLSRLAA